MPNCESRAILQGEQQSGRKTSKDPNRLAGGASRAHGVVENLPGQLVEAEDDLVGVDIAFQQDQHLNVPGASQFCN